MRRADARGKARYQRGRIRLIGGEWRGRRLEVPNAPGLRPTGDRVRETLFNWLQGELVGRRCLDLFAGSGALAFEALSRGAACATLVESSRSVQRALASAAERLGATARVHLVGTTAEEFLRREAGRGVYDLVFVDPPFAESEHLELLFALNPVLAAPATIYLELPADRGTAVALPDDWWPRRCRRFGDVTACLYDRAACKGSL